MDRRDLESGQRMLEGLAGMQELLRRARLGATVEESEEPVFRPRLHRRAMPSRAPRTAAAMAPAAPHLRQFDERPVPRGCARRIYRPRVFNNGLRPKAYFPDSHQATGTDA